MDEQEAEIRVLKTGLENSVANAKKFKTLLALWLEHLEELGDGTPTVSLDELAQRTRKALDD